MTKYNKPNTWNFEVLWVKNTSKLRNHITIHAEPELNIARKEQFCYDLEMFGKKASFAHLISSWCLFRSG